MNILLRAICIILLCSSISCATTQTINTLPANDSAFLSTLQTFLKNENAQRFQLQFAGFIYSGGIGTTAAGLSHTISVVIGMPGGYYVTKAATSHTYTNTKRTYVYLDYDDSRTITISGATVTRSTYLVFAEMVAGSSQPTTPTNAIPLMCVDTSGGAITAVSDIRSMAPIQYLSLTADTTVTQPMNIPPGLNIQLNGYTLTINGPFQAGHYQVFSGTGTVTFGSGSTSKLSPQWWGAVSDCNGTTGTDSTAAINAAIVSASASGGIPVEIVGRFKTLTPITLLSKVDLVGGTTSRLAAWNVATTYPQSEIHNAGTGNCINVKDSTGYRNKISGITITGNAASAHGIDISGVYDGEISNCFISYHGGRGINGGSAQSWNVTNNFIVNNKGVGLQWSGTLTITGNHIQGNTLQGALLTNYSGAFHGNTVEGNNTSGGYADLYIFSCVGASIVGNYIEVSNPNLMGIFLGGAGSSYINGLVIQGNTIVTSQNPITTGIYGSAPTLAMSGVNINGNYIWGFTNGVNIVTTGGEGLVNSVLGPNMFDTWTGYGVENHYTITGPYSNVIVNDGQGAPWRASTAVYYGNKCTNDSGKVYTCITGGTTASSGGPTGTGADITDGGAHWQYTAARSYFQTLYGNTDTQGIHRENAISALSGSDYAYDRAGGRTIADSGDDAIGMGYQGFIMFSASDNEYALAHVSTAGTVTLLHNSTNISVTKDNASTWNIYADGTSATIHVQNKRGTSKNYMFKSVNGFY